MDEKERNEQQIPSDDADALPDDALDDAAGGKGGVILPGGKVVYYVTDDTYR